MQKSKPCSYEMKKMGTGQTKIQSGKGRRVILGGGSTTCLNDLWKVGTDVRVENSSPTKAVSPIPIKLKFVVQILLSSDSFQGG